MVTLAMAAPGAEILAPGARSSGLVPVLGGALLHRSGTRRFRAAGTTIEPDGVPDALVQGGVFSLTRNPMYLAGAVILLGVAVLLGAASPFVVLPVWVWGTAGWFIAAEERVLEERFGDDYAAYRESVRRWL